MKKLLSLLAIGAMLFSTSCSDDADVSSSSDEVSSNTSTVSLTVGASVGAQSRSYSDGYTATKLYYAVYQVDTSSDDVSLTLLDELSAISAEDAEDFPDGSLETTVSLKLVNGNTYSVLFWAQADFEDDEDVFELDFETDETNPTLTINTENLISNTEDYDAFFKYHEIGKVTGNITETIELRRPVAQLNFGTDDYDDVTAAGVDITQLKTEVKVVGLNDKLNLRTGETSLSSEDVSTVTYQAALRSNYNADEGDDDYETFPVTGYEYLSMNYLLFDEESGTVDLTLTVSSEDSNYDGNTIEVSSVPVQRNYRTNIYGSLLTSTVNYTIEKVPEYYTPDNNMEIVEVSDAASLLDALEDGTPTIVLTDDIEYDGSLTVTSDTEEIDLNGYDMTTTSVNIEQGSELTIDGGGTSTIYVSDKNGFHVEGDGSDVTISNLTIISTYEGSSPNGLYIGDSSGDTQNNTVTISNVTIDVVSETTKGTGILLYGNTNEVIIEDCTINHGYFGITQNGTSSPGSTVTVTGTTITGPYAGIYMSSNADAAQNTLTVTDCTITGTEESPIEVKKTNLTVSSSELICEATTQSYSLKGNGSNGVGYGIVLAGYSEGVSYDDDECEVSLSEITYTLSATSNNLGSDIWNVCKYNGSTGVQVEDDGAATE